MTDEELASMWFDARDEYEQSEPGTNVTRLRAFARRIAEAEREQIIASIPGGSSVDPQWVCDMIRARGEK